MMKTCERHDRSLALYVEDDLPPAEVATLEHHLEACTRCQAVLLELEASQNALKFLAAESLPERALAAMRERVLAEARRETVPAHAVPAWVWASAAAVIAALALVLGVVGRGKLAGPGQPVADLARPAPTLEPERPGASRDPRRGAPATEATPSDTAIGSHGAVASPEATTVPPGWSGAPLHTTPSSDRVASGTARPGPEGPSESSVHSTIRRPRSVYRSEAPTMAEPESALTSEEADQLARAVVALSGIEEISDVSDVLDASDEAYEQAPHRATGSTGSLARWTTADPDVVIYWQLDSNGGES